MKILVVLALLAVGGQAQNVSSFYLFRSLSGTSNIITVRQPATGGRALALKGVWFTCSVACTYTVSEGGTVTGGSGGTILSLDDRGRAAVSSVVLDGTVSGETDVISGSLAADGSQSLGGCTIGDNGKINPDGLYLTWDGTTRKQFTVKLTASSGTLTIHLEWFEEGR